jgi:phosphopantothenate synthetase
MIDCPKFAKMQKMFHGKYVIVVEVQPVVKTQTVIVDVNVVDVNVITRGKVTKEQVFKDRKPRKAKSVVDWEEKKRLKQSMVEIIQHI